MEQPGLEPMAIQNASVTCSGFINYAAIYVSDTETLYVSVKVYFLDGATATEKKYPKMLKNNKYMVL